MKRFAVIFISVVTFLIGCEAAEDLLNPRKPPSVQDIRSNKGFEINPGDTVIFSVSATNPENGELTYRWSEENDLGTFLGSIFENSAEWIAPLAGGNYEIKVKVSNDYKDATKDAEIRVRTLTKPYVKILSPIENSFLVQNTTQYINFDAWHADGIGVIHLLINDIIVDSLFGVINQNNYNKHWVPSPPAGITEIKIEASTIAQNLVGKDSIYVTIEGIIPGKRND